MEDLKKRAEALKESIEPKENHKPQMGAARVGTELAGGVIVGGVMGFGLDALFHTKPVFLIICFILGAIAGFYNIYRMVLKDTKE